MYEYIKGAVTDKGADYAVVEANGIGYLILCSANTLNRLSVGEKGALYIHLHVAEDAMAMYGFISKEEREMFRKLNGVSRIGKKIALCILSCLTPNDIALAVSTDNAAAFDSVPGMGRKTAQRVILELKEKVTVSSGQDLSADSEKTARELMMHDAIEALISLGYDGASAGRAVGAVKSFSGVEELIKKSLIIMTSK